MRWFKEKAGKLYADLSRSPEPGKKKDYLFEAILILVMTLPMSIAEPRPSVLLGLAFAVFNLFMASQARETIKHGTAAKAEEASRHAQISSAIALGLIMLNSVIVIAIHLAGS